MLVSLGSIIGSGWLLGELTASSAAGGASVLSWVLAGAVMVLLALVHAELAATYPFTGGTARYPRIAFGALAGFTAGWVGWLATATTSPIEVEAALSYLGHLWPGLVNASGELTGQGLVIAVVLMAVFTVVNVLGVRWLAESNRVVMLWKIAVPVATVIVLLVVSFHPSNFTAGGFAPFGAHGVFAALPLGVIFALTGFEQAVQLGGESRNPQRDLPRAVIGAVLIGTVIYLGLEIAFIGSLNPANLLGGWAAPVGKGDFGPYATIATTLGLGWLTVILYTDAFLSPSGAGLVYVGTSARLSYAMGYSGQVPRSVARISKRGVPWVSLLISFVVGIICFLPFPSWQGFVGLVTSAVVLMYGFAPVTLMALRRSDPDRERPYRLKGAAVIAPLAFVAASEIIYWTAWPTVEKLLILVAAGLVIFGLYHAFGPHTDRRQPLDARSMLWILPWFIGLGMISYLGQYGGIGLIPPWVDLGVVAVFALAVFHVGERLALPPQRVAEQLLIEATEAAAETATR
ncbi:APC family permease [Pseudonocardia alaniniphila]|uniref:APC family permease n=1 Tax=Pseudonocardia alaniniphila TaxID=75291 RepID=A0ABS9T997_9PSEU|nr:APC family permease [Pseudonocardia alaniniphila]MCH6165119.1 APC family permease [Pseudonocardia alaniniphila]